MSECVDAGNSTFLPSDSADLDMDSNSNEPLPRDLDLKPRSAFDIPDMGAYDFQSTCPEDIFPANSASRCGDGDGTVGPGDLSELLVNWGSCQGCCADLFPTPANGGGDGTVGAGDLAELYANYGNCGGESFDGGEGGDETGGSDSAQVAAMMAALETAGFDSVDSFLEWSQTATDNDINQIGYLLQTIIESLI